MSKIPLAGAVMLVCGLLMSGCDNGETKQAQTGAAAPPATEATAWWKTEGQQGAQSQGAKVTGEPLPGWKSVDTASASQGKELFSVDCASCHTFGKGGAAGPDLQGITHRNTPEWNTKFISAPETMVKSDPHAKELMNKYLVQMPNFNLKPDQVKSINAYLRQQDEAAAHAK